MENYYRNRTHLFSILVLPYVLLMALSVFANLPVQAMNDTAKEPVHAKVLQGAISQSELIDNLERLGIKCIIHENAAEVGTLSVEKVRLGSSAYYGGVLAGDAIKDLHRLNANTFSLSIERTGKRYRVNLEALSGQLEDKVLSTGVKKDLLRGTANHQDLSAEVGVQRATLSTGARKDLLQDALNHQDLSTETAIQKTALNTGIQDIVIPGSVNKKDNPPEKKLLPYDIELIIDITGSMGWVDGTGNLTKFEWCHEQVRDLARLLNPYHKTMTITTFNTSYQTMEGCTPEKIEQIYATIEPNGNTDLVDPLMDRLNNALAKHKPDGHPVLVVVITDGLPNVPRNPRVVNRALIDFTQRLSNPEEIVVTILQIGDTFEGRDFCVDLDDNLVNEGAKYDIVDTKTFAELKQEGLVNAMIDAIVEAKNNRHLSRQEKHLKRFMNSLPPSSPSIKNADSELQKRQEERRAVEQQILGR